MRHTPDGRELVDADRLKTLPLFGDLAHHDLQKIARWADDIDLPTGKTLVAQGAFAHEFMVLESGTAEVTVNGEHVADLGPGDFFGEMALLEHQRRSATVTATSDLRVVVMHERDFRAMEDDLPEVARAIRATMDERRQRNAGSTDPA
jgi:CRP/FNR family cyclic AMP-dependent transcriptional regulator